MTLDTMDYHHCHSNYGEMRKLFDTWTRVWGAGGRASLHIHTLDSKARVVLVLRLGHLAAPRPGAPDVHVEGSGQPGPQHQHPQKPHPLLNLHPTAGGTADLLMSGATRGGTGDKKPGALQPLSPSQWRKRATPPSLLSPPSLPPLCVLDSQNLQTLLPSL